jgi:D-galactonate transporter
MSILPELVSLNEDVVYGKVTRRLIPLLFCCYIVAYLDRVNVGFAKLQMQSDLHLSDTVYGIGAGIFFIGYFFFEIPSNLLMRKVGTRFWIARIMISWGFISAATLFTTGPLTFYGLRFLLGLAEAGFFPGVILYLTDWYPSRRRARIVAWFMMAIAVTGVIGGPLSGWILQSFTKVGGLAGWQWLFLLEGIPSILMGIAVLLYLDNDIREAKWLTENERELLLRNLKGEEQKKAHLSVGRTLRNPWVLLFSAIYFCISMGLYGVGFWLPQIIKNTGVKNPLGIGLLTSIPYACAAIAMILVGKSSDRSGERRWHFAICALVGGVGLILSTLFPSNVSAAIVMLSIGTAGILSSFPLSWTMPTAMLAGSAAAAGIAMVNSIGGLAGFVSPYLVGWIADATHRLDVGLYVIASCLFLGAFLVVAVVPVNLPGAIARKDDLSGRQTLGDR